MNRILIMCEGPNEKIIMDILLSNECLNFSQDDLLGLTTFHARQISSSGQVRTELNMFQGKVDVYRIGDTQSDKLSIPKDYKDKIGEIRKYCTKPELEMLLIIAEGLEKNLPSNMFLGEKGDTITVQSFMKSTSGAMWIFSSIQSKSIKR